MLNFFFLATAIVAAAVKQKQFNISTDNSSNNNNTNADSSNNNVGHHTGAISSKRPTSNVGDGRDRGGCGEDPSARVNDQRSERVID